MRRSLSRGRVITLCGLVATLCAACSAPPPAAATVNVPPPPPPASAAPSATPSAVASAEPDSDTNVEDTCAKQLEEAHAGPHDTASDCDELVQKVASVQGSCAPETEYAVFAILEGAGCVDDIADARFNELKAKLPAADAATQEAAHKAFGGAVQGFCTRGTCSMHYGAVCAAGLSRYHLSWIEQAKKGELEFEDAKPQGKAVRGFFTEFAKGLCALPSTAWKGGARPKGCVERVLAAVEGGQGPETCND